MKSVFRHRTTLLARDNLLSPCFIVTINTRDAYGAHAVSGDDAPLNLIMNPIDIGQLNNSNRKTWNWSIRYGIDQLNSPIDQSLVLMVTMKQMPKQYG